MAEFNITAIRTVSDPQERQRQWGQVYRLLMTIPSRTRHTPQEKPANPGELSATKSAPTAEG